MPQKQKQENDESISKISTKTFRHEQRQIHITNSYFHITSHNKKK